MAYAGWDAFPTGEAAMMMRGCRGEFRNHRQNHQPARLAALAGFGLLAFVVGAVILAWASSVPADVGAAVESTAGIVEGLTRLNLAVLAYIPTAIGLASALAAAFKRPAGGIMLALHKAINLLACNFGHAKNASAPDDGRVDD